MKIITTFGKKVPGPEEYSSLGYHLTIEATPDEIITKDRQRLAEYTRRLFAECRSRVEDEIAQEHGRAPRHQPEQRNGRDHRGRPAHQNGQSNGRQTRRSAATGGMAASPKQVNFLRSLANEAGLGYRGLEQLAHDEFGKDVRGLSKREASQLIEQLRAQ
jgi:hypothetical protein